MLLLPYSSEGLDSIFPVRGEHARCIPHIVVAAQRGKTHTHKSYIIIPGKTPLTQDCSFSTLGPLDKEEEEDGTRSREFPIFSFTKLSLYTELLLAASKLRKDSPKSRPGYAVQCSYLYSPSLDGI
jgi:hypothetical protein